MEVSFKELFDFLNNSFVLIVGGALLKAIYILFKMSIQTNRNTEDIEELQNYCGLNDRRVTDEFRGGSKSTRNRTK